MQVSVAKLPHYTNIQMEIGSNLSKHILKNMTKNS